MAIVDNKSKQRVIAKNIKHRMREGMLIVSIGIALFLLLSLVTYHNTDPSWSTVSNTEDVANYGGRVGAWIADIFLYFFGYVAYLFPFILAGLAWLTFRHPQEEGYNSILWRILKAIGFFAFLISSASLLEMFLKIQIGVPLDSGGVLGELIAPLFINVFNKTGTSLILIAMLLAGITLMFGISWINVFSLLFKQLIKSSQALLKRRNEYLVRHQEEFEEDAPIIISASMSPIIETTTATEFEKIQTHEITLPPVKKPQPKKIEQIIRERAKQVIKKISVDETGELPSVTLLDAPVKNQKQGFTASELENLSRLVEKRLEEFGIVVKVVAVYPGPVVTRFELELAPGMKAGKITVLAKDLARALSVPSVRVVEVIPGKSVVGLEIPNENREVVRLREILESNAYRQAESPLSLGLGKDIAGHPVVVDIVKMPHLLVAGTTGAGKSVSINAMLLSILLKATPEEVRLIMIDPKMLELSIYEGIPHLLAPVVTNMKEAANALRWCVAEMDRRYRLMAALSVRNLVGYNTKIIEASKKGEPLKDPFFVNIDDNSEPPVLKPLPKIVVVIDELADMMMVVGKQVEELVARIAQKARAAGIHMVLATQRPSVDVITGLIKANIPCRIAFSVSSRVDSRTILDQQGAEHLLGYGDMLYLPPGTSLPIRIHGAYVADDEVVRVVSAWKERASPEYISEVIQNKTDSEFNQIDFNLSYDEEEERAEQDPLYDKAVAIVVEARRASISLVQRRLKIGYNRAANMMEAMEAAGIVSEMENNGNREVLAPPPPKE